MDDGCSPPCHCRLMVASYPMSVALTPKGGPLTEQIIVPLDVASEAAAIALLDQLPQVQFWKVGLELFISCGPSILTHLKHRQKRIFLDLKLHDIPNTVAGACRAAARYGVDLLTIHAAAGRPALRAAQEALQQGADQAQLPPPKLIAITLLTSLSARDLAFDLKVPLELPDYALQMALLTQDVGLAGAVCSPPRSGPTPPGLWRGFFVSLSRGPTRWFPPRGSTALPNPSRHAPGRCQFPRDWTSDHPSHESCPRL